MEKIIYNINMKGQSSKQEIDIKPNKFYEFFTRLCCLIFLMVRDWCEWFSSLLDQDTNTEMINQAVEIKHCVMSVCSPLSEFKFSLLSLKSLMSSSSWSEIHQSVSESPGICQISSKTYRLKSTSLFVFDHG